MEDAEKKLFRLLQNRSGRFSHREVANVLEKIQKARRARSPAFPPDLPTWITRCRAFSRRT